MYELKKIGKVFTCKFVGTGPSSYKNRIYRAAVSQSLRNTALKYPTGFDEILYLQSRRKFVQLYIRIFRKILRKAAISEYASLPCMEQLGFHWRDFHKV